MRALAGLALAVLAMGLALERWPSTRSAVADPRALPAAADTRVRFSGAVRVREDEAILGPGEVELLVRSLHAAGAAAPTQLRATIGGEGLLRFQGLPPIRLRPTGGVVDLPLLTYHGISGSDGRDATFSRLRATVSGQAVMRFGPAEGPVAASKPSSRRARGRAGGRNSGTGGARLALKGEMAEDDEPLVEIRDLVVSYGPVQALSGVSGRFDSGPTGLLGPNGAGKTTLLKTLLGFLQPERGSLKAFGLDSSKQPLEVRRRLGYMPEQDCHLPGMSAAQFVAFAGELSGLPRDEAISRSHEVLYYVGLGEARYRNVETYSTGMKQRVKLAQALVHDPDLLLLDEPTNGLDPQGREEMLALIHDISTRRGMSLVLCSHLLKDVERVCRNVIVLNQGRVARAGTISELTGARRQVFDVRFKGDPSGVLTDLRDLGAEWSEGEDAVRLFLPEGRGPEAIFQAARNCGVQVRLLRPGAETLEDVFLRALGHEAQL